MILFWIVAVLFLAVVVFFVFPQYVKYSYFVFALSAALCAPFIVQILKGIYEEYKEKKKEERKK